MKQGVFELSMAEYRAEHGINQSALKRMAKSPAHVRAYIDYPKEPTRDKILGTVTHTSVLQPTELVGCCWVKPETYQSLKTGDTKKWNGNATECKDWLYAHQDRPIITTAEFDQVMGMSNAVVNNSDAAEAFAQGKPELSLFCEDPDTGLQLKCRPDWLSGNAIPDLKTTDDASPEGFARSIAKFGYDVQAAFYLDVAAWLNLGKEFFLFIAVEKEFPFAVAVYELDADSIQVGRSKYRRWLTQYSICVGENKWPAYPSGRQVISLPAWSRKAEETAMLEYSARPVPAIEYPGVKSFLSKMEKDLAEIDKEEFN